MFDFADVTENEILCWNIQFTFCVFWQLPIGIQEVHRKDIVLTRENWKHEWSNLYY